MLTVITDKIGNIRVYPTSESSYKWSCKEESKFKRRVVNILKKKKLPKAIEVSWIESLLKDLKNMPEHEYSNKYDTLHSQHRFFY